MLHFQFSLEASSQALVNRSSQLKLSEIRIALICHLNPECCLTTAASQYNSSLLLLFYFYFYLRNTIKSERMWYSSLLLCGKVMSRSSWDELNWTCGGGFFFNGWGHSAWVTSLILSSNQQPFSAGKECRRINWLLSVPEHAIEPCIVAQLCAKFQRLFFNLW